MEKSEKKAYLYNEHLRRLSNQKYWEEIKKIYNISSLNEFGIDIYEKLEAYQTVLKGKVERAMQIALSTQSATELNLIRAELESINLPTGRLRFFLNCEEQKINGMIKGIDGILKKNFRVKPEHIFYHPKSDKVIEKVICPYCGKTNTNFEYDKPCRFCHIQIGNLWKEHTICPNIECSSVINRREIYEDPQGYDLDSSGQITCPYCETRFDWKKYRRQPEKMGLKVCINCNMSFIPNKYNWHKQRVCLDCKDNWVDPFKLDNPEYQKNYRSKKKKWRKIFVS